MEVEIPGGIYNISSIGNNIDNSIVIGTDNGKVIIYDSDLKITNTIFKESNDSAQIFNANRLGYFASVINKNVFTLFENDNIKKTFTFKSKVVNVVSLRDTFLNKELLMVCFEDKLEIYEVETSKSTFNLKIKDVFGNNFVFTRCILATDFEDIENTYEGENESFNRIDWKKLNGQYEKLGFVFTAISLNNKPGQLTIYHRKPYVAAALKQPVLAVDFLVHKNKVITFIPNGEKGIVRIYDIIISISGNYDNISLGTNPALAEINVNLKNNMHFCCQDDFLLLTYSENLIHCYDLEKIENTFELNKKKIIINPKPIIELEGSKIKKGNVIIPSPLLMIPIQHSDSNDLDSHHTKILIGYSGEAVGVSFSKLKWFDFDLFGKRSKFQILEQQPVQNTNRDKNETEIEKTDTIDESDKIEKKRTVIFNSTPSNTILVVKQYFSYKSL